MLFIIRRFRGLVVVGEKAMEDGKISLDDIMLLGELGKEVKNLVVVLKEYKELLGEAKDIDALEAIEFIRELIK